MKPSVLFLAALLLIPSATSSFPKLPAGAVLLSNPYRSIGANTCLNDTALRVPTLDTKVAFVEPVFTSTAYFHPGGNFYDFYTKYTSVTNGYVTTDLSWLEIPVVNDWGWSLPMYEFLVSSSFKQCGFSLGDNVAVITDSDVSNGGLLAANGSLKFNSVVTAFTEYAQ